MKQSIVWLRMMATLLIINSHFTPLYPTQLQPLSFGGMFGDCLFFFISGYCLARQNRSFGDFAWRRIKRVYIPYLLFIPFLILAGTTQKWTIGYTLFPYDTYGFITVILCLYPIFYIFMWLDNHTKFKFWHVASIITIMQLSYFAIMHNTILDILEDRPLEVSTFLLSMILGGVVRNNVGECKRIVALLGVLVCFGVYALNSLVGLPKDVLLLQWWVGAFFVFFLARLVISFEDNLKVYPVVQKLADITLEVYFVNYYIIRAFTGTPFPNDIILCLLSIVGVASAFHWFFDYAINWIEKGTERVFSKS